MPLPTVMMMTPGRDEVDVLDRAGLFPECAAEHVDEQQQHRDRRQHDRDDRVEAARRVTQASFRHGPGVSAELAWECSFSSSRILKNTSSSVGVCLENRVGSIPLSLSRMNMSAISATEPWWRRPASTSTRLTWCSPSRAALRRGQLLLFAELQLDEPGRHHGLQLVRWPLGHDPAAVEDGDLVGEVVGLFEVLRGEEDRGPALGQLSDGLPHVGRGPWGRARSSARRRR